MLINVEQGSANPSVEKVYSLFRTVTQNASFPAVVHDNPGNTRFTFSTELYGRIAALPGVASIKIPPLSEDLHQARSRINAVPSVIPKHVTIGISGDPTAATGLLAGRDDESPRKRRHRSEALKERVYVTFTVLAVTIAFERDAEHATVGGAVVTLLLTVIGTLLAVFVADIIAHMVREGSLPSRAEMLHLMYVSFGSLAVVVLPLAILGASALGVIDLVPALRAIAVTLIATLLVVTLLAIRRLRVGPGLKVLVLAIMSTLGLGVLALELSIH